MKDSIFKAYDIRGVYPSDLDESDAFLIGRALGAKFQGRVVVGCDSRASSPALLRAVIRGIRAASKRNEVFDAGLITTPMLYFLVRKRKAALGAMVSASHNPKEWNGIKAVDGKGRFLTGTAIERIVGSRRRFPEGVQGGLRPIEAVGAYARFLRPRLKLRTPLRIVFDSSNGTTGAPLKAILEKRKDARAFFLNDVPDGNFPGHSPNPMGPGAMDRLKDEVVRRRADCGVIFDADGDRVFLVDDKGREVHADIVTRLLAERFPQPILIDVRIGWLIRRAGIRFVESRVGHAFIKKTMRERDLAFGAEASGHYYFKDFFHADSGIRAALEILNAVSELAAKRFALSRWIDSLPSTARSGELNFPTHAAPQKLLHRVKRRYAKGAERVSERDGLTLEFPDWRANIRPSNTEPVIRLNVEAVSDELLARKIAELRRTGRF